jgi:hypothetical protein
MARRLPKDLARTIVVLEVDNPSCSACGRQMHVKKHHCRRVYTLQGPVRYVSKLMQCSRAACPNHRRTFSPEQERTLAMPRWLIGWDVFSWLGHRSAPTAASALNGMDVVLDYCAAVRGIINDSQGGPLRPPGLRMSEALGEVRKSLGRNLRLKKGDTRNRCWND